ncbi:MAG TPA: hypothetical protein ENN03_07045 [bacterium]|nr:hypothetical protein [bacterium]
MKSIKTGTFILLLSIPALLPGSTPYSGSPPFSFSIPEAPMLDQFIVVSPLYNSTLRYVWRSETKIYGYGHQGNKMWEAAITNPATASDDDRGTKHGVADIDGDGNLEVVALNASNQLKIYDALTGTLKNTIDVEMNPSYPNQLCTYVVLANFEGKGTRNALVQTRHDPWDDGSYTRYVNRSLIAIDLEDGSVIWRVEQDADLDNPSDPKNTSAGYYEGYWQQHHGGPVVADIDGDGKDEVVGGSLIDDDGTVVPYGTNEKDYNFKWLDSNTGSVDHLDGIAVGDFRPDLKGLEVVVCQEDHIPSGIEGGTYTDWWHTVMLHYCDSDQTYNRLFRWQPLELWTAESNYPKWREPQNVAVGNFDNSYSKAEIWNRSRMGYLTEHWPRFEDVAVTGQYPWVFGGSNDATLLADYASGDVLPSDFNTPRGNAEGIDIIWTMDWNGDNIDDLGARARHGGSNIGVFNAMDGSALWHTAGTGDVESALFLYVADVGGDSREEMIVCDAIDGGSSYEIRVFWNTDPYTDTQPNKWDDPLYHRLKQAWNYYSPGSYMRRDPVTVNLNVFLEGAYDKNTGLMTTFLSDGGFIPLTSPYAEDPRIAPSIPDNTVDWILLELRFSASGHTVQYRSAFLRSDGQIIDEKGNAAINFFVEKQNDYYIIVKHRNHLAVMSRLQQIFGSGAVTYSFTTGSAQYHNHTEEAPAAKELKTGLWGLFAGDGNASGIISIADRNEALNDRDAVGYRVCDYNLSGIVTIADVNIALLNRDRYSKVPGET